MSLYDIIVSRRTIRQFKPVPVARVILEMLVNAARLAPSAGNLQPLEFVVVDEAEVREKTLSCLHWASYIAPAGDPRHGNEPMAYIVSLVNLSVREKGYEYDVGAAMGNMILAGLEEGLGACWLISIDREKLAEILRIPEGYRVDCVLALGYPDEYPLLEEIKNSVKYWKDEKGILHVPKRSLRAVIHYNTFS